MQLLGPGLAVVAVRTPTLPPATATNAWVIGTGLLTVVDPASPHEAEQARLLELLDERRASGERVERIVLTHHHHDHVAGAEALRDALGGVPIAAHAATADLLRDDVQVDAIIADGDALACGGRTLVAHHTPGHAAGHLVFLDTQSRDLIAGDLVAGIGTILIDPRDGTLTDYLESLATARALQPKRLLPAHGPVLAQADAVLGFYIAHRHQRSVQVQEALRQGGAMSASELVPHVYADLPAAAYPVAAVQLTAHLHWLVRHGLVAPTGEQRYATLP